MIIFEHYRKTDIGGVAFVERIKKPKDRSGKDAQYYGLPVSFIEA